MRKSKIKRYLTKPFLVWEKNNRRKWKLFVLIMLFAIGFKFVYHPFGISPDHGLKFFVHHAAISAFVLLFQLFILPKLFGGYFHESIRTLGRQISWVVLLFILLIVFHGVYNILTAPISISEAIWNSVWINLGIGVYPVIVIFILAYIRQLSEKIPTPKASFKETKENLLCGNIKISTIIYIKSLDNYSEIYYVSEEVEQKSIIRKSLNALEKDLLDYGFIRLHRSYIVNRNFIASVRGNTNKTLVLLKHFNLEIPVSRTKRQELLDIIT